MKFLEDLKNLAIEIKDIEQKERKNYLINKVANINLGIDKKLRNFTFDFETDLKVKFQGLVFPIKTGDDEDPFLIVNLVPERGHVFNTKKRAPVMICFETI